jgi:hypothetical protein
LQFGSPVQSARVCAHGPPDAVEQTSHAPQLSMSQACEPEQANAHLPASQIMPDGHP